MSLPLDRDDEQRHTSPGAAGVYEGAAPPVLMVRVKGLEPIRLSAPDPKSGLSTNSNTPAVQDAKIIRIFYLDGTNLINLIEDQARPAVAGGLAGREMPDLVGHDGESQRGRRVNEHRDIRFEEAAQ